ncbi:MAG: PIN domain-containing protein [Saprospiraceae bacterium]|nr:PIN domain-containing protein [Saprospiraceae bacterium]
MRIFSHILVDTSVWIHYFKDNADSVLDTLITENLVITNELILSELIPFAEHARQSEMIEGLRAIELLPLDIYWEGIRRLQLLNLQHGINNVGIPDLIIAQQAVDQKIQLWSLDKHFALMAGVIKLSLFQSSAIK